jgi:SOS-response transcriptional repressor LexA
MPPTANPNPSEKQLELVLFIIRHVERWGYQPSRSEMAAHFKVTKSAINGRLIEAEARGIIKIQPGKERAILLKYIRFQATTSDEP